MFCFQVPIWIFCMTKEDDIGHFHCFAFVKDIHLLMLGSYFNCIISI